MITEEFSNLEEPKSEATLKEETKASLYICRHCSHILNLPENELEPLNCERCGQENDPFKPKSVAATVAFALTALILYIPANVFPFMSIELYGNRNSSTIWSGVVSLANDGAWAIAIIVFLASIVIPFLKLLALFYLAFSARKKKNPLLKTKLYHAIEAIGRWSMLDIFILAILVTIMKLGPWTHVEPELGSLLFLGVVICTMIASSQFDPKILWEDEL